MHINLQVPKRRRFLLLAFLLLHVIASYIYISYQNITFDEPQYIEYAKHWLHGKPERVNMLDDSKSPVVAVCWLPRIVRQIINPHYELHDYGRKDQQEGRHMMVLFSLIAALYVYWWCRDLYGAPGWVLPLLLLLFDPLFLAYSTLITTDLACGTFLIALLYHFRRYLVLRSRRDFYLSAIYTTLAVVTKQNMLYVLLLLPLLAIIFKLLQPQATAPVVLRPWSVVWSTVLFLLIIIGGINIIYYFHRSFIPLGDFHFESNAMQSLQGAFSFLHWLPVPLPHNYVQSIDMLKAHAELGGGKPESSFNGVYLFGQLKLTGGFWYYYIVLLWYKMPIGTMLLFIAGIVLFVRKFRLQSFAQQYMFLVIPIVYYFIILSLFNQFQIGIRHLLLLYPIMFVGLGYVFHYLAKASVRKQVVAGCAIAYTFISVGVYYPYIIPYTNELAGDKKLVYKKIIDSSMDYGQSDSSVNVFIAAHPAYKKPTAVPDTGKVAATMAQVVNTDLREQNPCRWLQKLQPKGLYRYVVLLYDVKEKDLRRLDSPKSQRNVLSH